MTRIGYRSSSAQVLTDSVTAKVPVRGSSGTLLAEPITERVVVREDSGRLLGSNAVVMGSAPNITSIVGFLQVGATSFSCTTSRPAQVRFKMVNTITTVAYFTDWTAVGTSHNTNTIAPPGPDDYDFYVEANAVVDPDRALTYLSEENVGIIGTGVNFPDVT